MKNERNDRHDAEALVGKLAEEFLHEIWLGRHPSIDDVAVRYPAVSELIYEVFPTLLLAAEVQSNEPTLRLDCQNCDDGYLMPVLDSDRSECGTYVCSACCVSQELVELAPRLDNYSANCDSPTLARIESAIAHYDIKAFKLGEGGFGDVWLADNGNEWVAVKIPRSRPSASQWRRYVSEVNVHLQLPPHPYIVGIRDYGKDSDTYFIVLDFKTATQLDSRDQPSAKHTKLLMTRIAEAVAHLHKHDTAHRDLSPKNILIDEADDSIPYLLDFGLAKTLAGNGGYERDVTTVGQIVGNQRYMSPEQRRGVEGHDLRRSDVFSLGVIFFEMLTGEYPFEGRDTAQKVSNKNSGLFKSVLRREQRQDVDPSLTTIVDRCLDEDPHKRFADAVELETALRKLPLDARSAHGRRGTFTRRIITGLFCVGVMAICLVPILRDAEELDLIASLDKQGTVAFVNCQGTAWNSLSDLLRQGFSQSTLRDIETLSVSHGTFTLNDSDFDTASGVRAIELSNCKVDWKLRNATEITYLHIAACTGFEDLDVSVFPQATYIKVMRMEELESVAGFENINSELICLDHNPNLALVEGIAGHTKLRDLQISACPKLGVAIGPHLKSLTKLRTLTLTHVDLFTLDFLVDCHDLQAIAIDYVPSLQPITTLQDLKRLRKLCITNCPRVDWHPITNVPRVDVYGDAWVETALISIAGDRPMTSSDYWKWRGEMIQERIAAGRGYDVFLD